MTICETQETWASFIAFVKERCSSAAFGNWISPIELVAEDGQEVTLKVPNVFVKEYLLSNFREDLCSFLPVKAPGQPSIKFVIEETKVERKAPEAPAPAIIDHTKENPLFSHEVPLNKHYGFNTLIEGPSNQFVKSAAMGVAMRPGQSYNPLFIHGGVGLGKTHILHAVGHYVREHNKKLRVQCITTEQFINDLVDCLRNKSIDRMKRFYRSDVDVLLVDDIQFLQNRLNFEEEFCNTFEALINQNKQIVVTSDKPPGQLKLSERMVARMEWGLVAHIGIPDLETRVAILQSKAELKGLKIPSKVAFFIAEHVNNNVRQLEGAVNRLSAQCRLLDMRITEDMVENTLREMLQHVPQAKVSVEQILKSVAAVFGVRVSDLKGSSRTKLVALPRQVAMYLAKEMINDSLQTLGASFGKSHSTILHACKNIDKKLMENEILRRQVSMVRRNVEA